MHVCSVSPTGLLYSYGPHRLRQATTFLKVKAFCSMRLLRNQGAILLIFPMTEEAMARTRPVIPDATLTDDRVATINSH